MKNLLTGLVLISTVYTSPSLAEGTRGGGNAIGGKLIESYIIDPAALSEYITIVSLLLKSVRTKSPCFANGLESVFQKSAWYFIPADLVPLAKDITGIPLGSNQVASQVPERHEIWVNSDKYNNELATNEERAKLLVHEAILGTISTRTDGFSFSYTVDDRVHAQTRKIVSLLFSKAFNQMSPNDFAEKVYSIGVPYGENLNAAKKLLSQSCRY